MSKKEKKSFIAYNEWHETFKELTDEEAGILIKKIFDFTNGVENILDNKVIKMAFIPIKQCLIRDSLKWDIYLEKQSKNGKLGGRPTKPKKPNPLNQNPPKPKKADNVNANANANISDDDILKPFNNFIADLKEGKHQESIKLWYIEFDLKAGTLTSLLTVGFKSQLLLDKTLHEDPSSLMKHFKNWLNFMNHKGSLKEYKKNH